MTTAVQAQESLPGEHASTWTGRQYFSRQQQRWFAIMPDGRRIFRYRAVIEQQLGRPLTNDEIVHHINGDQTDDRPENLQLVQGDQGYHTSIIHYGYTDERLLELLCEHAQRINGSPTSGTLENDPEAPCVKTYYNRFGSLKNALIKAGLYQDDQAWRWHAYTEQELIEKLVELKGRIGRRPILADLVEHADMPHPSTFKKVFGTWMNALNAAGLASLPNPRRNPSPKYSRETLIQQLHTLQARLGRRPTRRDLKNYPEFASKSTFTAHFGSWNAALKEAGLL